MGCLLTLNCGASTKGGGRRRGAVLCTALPSLSIRRRRSDENVDFPVGLWKCYFGETMYILPRAPKGCHCRLPHSSSALSAPPEDWSVQQITREGMASLAPPSTNKHRRESEEWCTIYHVQIIGNFPKDRRNVFCSSISLKDTYICIWGFFGNRGKAVSLARSAAFIL